MKVDPGGGIRPEEDASEHLDKENAGASENEILDGWSDEAAPIKANARGAKRRSHVSSVRRAEAFRQKKMKEHGGTLDSRFA